MIELMTYMYTFQYEVNTAYRENFAVLFSPFECKFKTEGYD